MPEHTNSEIHKLITDAINSLRNDFQREASEIKLQINGLRPCIVTRQSCDERHSEIEKRMVDKSFFRGVMLAVTGILAILIGVAGIVIKLWLG